MAPREILVVHHSHYDHGYVHPASAERTLQVRFWRQALALIERTPDLTWTSELSRPVLDWLEQATPEEVARARRLIATDRIGIGALAWNTTPLADADELRRLATGASLVRERLGDPCRTAFQHDVNGLPWPAVGILRDAGVDLLAMAINVHQGGCAVGRHRVFRWEGPDGRDLLVYNGDHYGQLGRTFRFDAGTVAAMQAGWTEYADRLRGWGVDLPFVYLTCTIPGHDDCNPPNEEAAALMAAWNREGGGPPVRFVTPEGLRRAVHGLPPALVGRERGDWTDWWNVGCGSSAMHTALARRARRHLRAAERIAPTALETATVARAQAAVESYHEHTWGSPSAVRRPDLADVVVQWDHKAADASVAAALADLCLHDALHALAGNPDWARGPQGVLVANTADVPVTAPLCFPRQWRESGWLGHQGAWTQLEQRRGHTAPEDLEHTPALTLPPRAWRTLTWAELDALPISAPEITADRIVGADLDLRFDPGTGRVQALRARADGRELLTAGGTEPLGIVREEVDASACAGDLRRAYFHEDWTRVHRGESMWRADWPARRQGPLAVEAVEIRRTPGSATLVRRLRLPGWSRLELRLTLRGDRGGLDLELDGRLADETHPVAYYLALPLRLPAGWRCHFDTAGAATELDADQLPGAVRDWLTVDRYVCLHHGAQGVLLTCPDAPLVMPAGFGYGRASTAIARTADPLLLAWPLNTYWQTNFRASQPGPVALRWCLHPIAGFAATTCAALGTQGALPVHPVMRLRAGAAGHLPG